MTHLPKAFLFDLNGTMVDDMEYHTQAWFQLLNQKLMANLSYADVAKEMYGKNAELLVRVFGPNRFSEQEISELSAEKEKSYRQSYLPHLKLIGGLDGFLAKAQSAGMLLAVGSAAIRSNVDFVLDNLDARRFFSAIVSADDVAASKPHPETFVKAASLLGVEPGACIVFEDAPKGVEAAANAGMQAVVITSVHGREDFSAYHNIICFIDDYNDPALNQLVQGEAAGQSNS